MRRAACPALLLVVALTFAPAIAGAAPAAELIADVDRDGAPDVLRIDAPGWLTMVSRSGATKVVMFGRSGPLTDARLSFAATPTPTVVASAQLGGAWEAIALAAGPSGLTELWRGPVGPAGDDDEYELVVEARPDGLWRFQTRADLRRCDGAAIELFPERWDPRARRFAPAAMPVPTPPAEAPTVTATPAALAPVAWFRPSATSRATGATDAGMLVAPRALADGDPATAWTAPGDGHGTWWLYRTSLRGGRAAAIRIAPGAGKHRRAARLWVAGGSGHAVIAIPPGPAAVYQATLPAPLEGCVAIALLATHPGGPAAAVPELQVIADVELDPQVALGALIDQVVAGGLAGDSAARALVALGAAAEGRLLTALASAAPDARRRLLAVVAERPTAASLPTLAEAVRTGEIAADRREAVAARLASLGPAAHVELATHLARPGDKDGQRAIVGALAAAAPAALLAATGVGDRAIRRAVAQALARLPLAELIAAAQTGATPEAQADRWRALGIAAAAAPVDQRGPARAALAVALASAGKSYELRYRTLAALAPIADDAAVAALAAYLDGLPDTAAGRALARIGARGLADNPSLAARATLARLAAAGDPGLRLEAIRGLSAPQDGEPGTGPVPDALVAALAGDRWPMIRQQAATALGARCAAPRTQDALIAAVGADAVTAVRVEAVAAVASCGRDGLDALLLGWIDDGRQVWQVRDRALAALAERPGASVDVALLTRFKRWRGAAFSDDRALRLAIRAATALGQRAVADAGPELVTAARDQAFPELAAAALRALGAVCPADAPSVLRAALGADDPGMAQAARAAAATCPRR
jgi:hypothetical protein